MRKTFSESVTDAFVLLSIKISATEHSQKPLQLNQSKDFSTGTPVTDKERPKPTPAHLQNQSLLNKQKLINLTGQEDTNMNRNPPFLNGKPHEKNGYRVNSG